MIRSVDSVTCSVLRISFATLSRPTLTPESRRSLPRLTDRTKKKKPKPGKDPRGLVVQVASVAAERNRKRTPSFFRTSDRAEKRLLFSGNPRLSSMVNFVTIKLRV